MESSHPETLQLLLKDDTIRNARVVTTANVENSIKTFGMAVPKPAEPQPQTKDNLPNGAPRQSDADLFASVVGIEGGELIFMGLNFCFHHVIKMRSTKRMKPFTVSRSTIPKWIQ
jgi:hypothetical protein